MLTRPSTTDTTTSRNTVAGCVPSSALFHDTLLEEPPRASAPAQARRRAVSMELQAADVCRDCPLMVECLYAAVVHHDVAGYAGGSTEKQRMRIRRQLQITVDPEDFDTLAGVTGRNRHVDHAEVLRLRNANPKESLEGLAHRLGCSLSTVKRHLHTARKGATGSGRPPVTPPSRTEVLAAYALVVHGIHVEQAA